MELAGKGSSSCRTQLSLLLALEQLTGKATDHGRSVGTGMALITQPSDVVGFGILSAATVGVKSSWFSHAGGSNHLALAWQRLGFFTCGSIRHEVCTTEFPS